MQASLRWNDDGGRNRFVAIPMPLAIPGKCLASALAVIPAQAGIQWFI